MNRKSMLALVVLLLAAAPSFSACLLTGNGYLRARMGGALDLDIDWRNAELECEGSMRPDGSGVRLSFAGPPKQRDKSIRSSS